MTTTDIDVELIDQVLELIPQFGKSVMRSLHRFADSYGAAGPFPLRDARATSRCPSGKPMPPMGHVKALLYLYRHGPMPVGQIAEWLQVSAPTASEQIDRMVEAGLVERHNNPRDRRQVLVTLTPNAGEAARHFWELQRMQISAVLSRFSPDERPLVIRTLKTFVEVFESDPEQLLADIGNQTLKT